MSRWGTADTNADRAAELLRNDERTTAQRKWDNHEHAITALVREINILGRPGFGWTRKAGAIEALRNLARDLDRETLALAIEGFREGDPVGGIPTLAQITTKVAKLGGAA